MEKYLSLKSNKNDNPSRTRWTIENIKDGMEYYKELNGKYPSSIEINNFEYLPSRKTIERSFGGLVSLRKLLNLEGSSDYTKGEVRSAMAQKAFIRAQNYEKTFYDFLISRIPEVRVHEHKIVRPGNTASDFFIYTSDNEGIMIDVFYAQDMHSLGGILRIKSLKSIEVKCPVYYVLIGNDQITQGQIDNLVNNRKVPLQNNIKIMTEEYFKSSIIDLIKLKPLSIQPNQ